MDLKLTLTERECLLQCARHHALTELPLNSESAMHKLESLGLIERIAKVCAPIEALRSGYRPTALGWSILRKMEP